jgi:hypothetical protein
MKQAIVTTTINAPTEALKKFAAIAIKDGWTLVVVGDMKTPHEAYADFVEQYEGSVVYLTPADQTALAPELSKLIGWNCIQRRNMGLVYAYQQGAEIMAVVDDDNIPYEKWGKNLHFDKPYAVSTFKTASRVFDPISPAFEHIWHRGFPLQLLDQRSLNKPQLLKRRILVQADMWDGSPDVDAVCRITLDPQVTFNPQMIHYAANVPGPFNSQNTFLHRDAMPDYFLFPHIGRMDDIWAAYYLQAKHPDSVCYAKASVFQDRNPHDLVKDLDAELIGYRHGLEFFDWCMSEAAAAVGVPDQWPEFMPKESVAAFVEYRKALGIVDGEAA